MRDVKQKGFSAVELLITLFIGSMFLISGYLVWGYTQRSSDEAYQYAIASNIAYNYLGRYNTNSGCTSPQTNLVLTMPNSGYPDMTEATELTNPVISIRLDCPTALSTQRLVKVTSTLSYGSGDTAGTVSHATYAK